jgi:hypothetical protein
VRTRRERERAASLRMARETGEAEREADERREAARRWGGADGGKGHQPAPAVPFEPSGPNEHTPRH